MLLPEGVILIPGASLIGATIGYTPMPMTYPLAAGGAPSEPGVDIDIELAGGRVRGSHVSGKRKDDYPAGGAVNVQPAPVLMPVSGSGAGSSASGGSGFFFFGVAGVLALFALGVPRLSFRLRLIKELGTPAPFVLLLDHPG